jgi:hypothetical protein
VAECVTNCNNDGNCLGFYHHNEDDLPTKQGSCFYYTANNAQATVGTGIEISEFFTTSSAVVGPQLPNTSTDVYLKRGQKYQELAGGTIKPNS